MLPQVLPENLPPDGIAVCRVLAHLHHHILQTLGRFHRLPQCGHAHGLLMQLGVVQLQACGVAIVKRRQSLIGRNGGFTGQKTAIQKTHAVDQRAALRSGRVAGQGIGIHLQRGMGQGDLQFSIFEPDQVCQRMGGCHQQAVIRCLGCLQGCAV